MIDAPFKYTENPGYVDLIQGTYTAMNWYYSKEMWTNYTFPASFISDFRKYYYFKFHESYPIFGWAVFFTLLRYLFEYALCKVSQI